MPATIINNLKPNAFEAFLREPVDHLRRAGRFVMDLVHSPRMSRAAMAALVLAVVLVPAAMAKPNVAPASPGPQPTSGQNGGETHQPGSNDLFNPAGGAEPLVFPGTTAK